MSQKNFVSHGDAETVLTEFADSIKSKEPKIFKGASAEWEALTAEEQAVYSVRCFTDDETETTGNAWKSAWSGSVNMSDVDGVANLVTGLTSIANAKEVALVFDGSNGSRSPANMVIQNINNFGCSYQTNDTGSASYGTYTAIEVNFSTGLIRGCFRSWGWTFTKSLTAVMYR